MPRGPQRSAAVVGFRRLWDPKKKPEDEGDIDIDNIMDYKVDSIHTEPLHERFF